MVWERETREYDGKAKRVWSVRGAPDLVILQFTDDATAFNGVKRASIPDKGRINVEITTHLLERVAAAGVPTHLVARQGEDLVCRRVSIIPVEIVVRNVCAGSLAKRYGVPEGTKLAYPLVEHFYKSDKLDDPLMTEEHAVLFGWATREELAVCRALALSVNDALKAFWDGLGVDLVDFKLEFGRLPDGTVVLADEITPDGSRLWERGTGRHLDKDVFRRDLGDLSATYRDLYARVFGRPFVAGS